MLATLPSGYDIFPHPRVTWLIDASGNACDDDLFDGATLRRYHWWIFDPIVAARIRAQHSANADAYLVAYYRYFDY